MHAAAAILCPSTQRRWPHFHWAFAEELGAVIDALPLTPQMRVLDIGCGDGFYMGMIADRLAATGAILGLDINPAYLKRAGSNPALRRARCQTGLIGGRLAELPLRRGGFDLVWCAQSLYSLPEPVGALRQMSQALRPGGLIAVLENDTLHQLLLPWPSHLEIALRAAEFVALAEQSRRPSKFYVGRRLPALLAEAGLEPLGFRTLCIDRQGPLETEVASFLQLYLQSLGERVRAHLADDVLEEFEDLIDPASPAHLSKQPHFTMTWLNVLAWGRQPSSAAT